MKNLFSIGFCAAFLVCASFASPILAQSPTDNATTPTTDAAEVVSVYGDSYTSIANNLSPDWAQSGSVNPAFDPGTGDLVMLYANFNYQGTELATTDASAMSYLHVDVWVAPGTDRLLKVTPVNNAAGGSGVVEFLVNVPLTPGSWNSVDLPKSAFTGMTWDNVFQMKFDGQFNGDGTANGAGYDVYLDNIYFWEDTSAPVSGCMDSNATNYVAEATVDDGTCTYNVTFRVDMANFTGASYGGVFINGTFNSWCGTCNPLADADQDGVWEVTLPLTAGTIEYKFTLDGWTQQEEFLPGGSCTVTNGGFTNRALTIDGVEDLSVVCWNTCAACLLAPGCMDSNAVNYDSSAQADDGSCLYTVTFQVDMANYDLPAGATVFTNGTYNGWCGGCNAMSDGDADGIWTGTFNLPAGDQEYKFTINGWDDQEYFNGYEACTTAPAEYVNRVSNISGPTTLPVVCWNTCDACADITNTTLGTGHATIQDAIDAASAGNVLTLAATTFNPTGTVTVDKSLTINGAGSGSTTIDVGGYIAWGIYITANDVTLSGVTIQGDAVANQQFALKAGSGNSTGGTPSICQNLTYSDIVIQGTKRTAIDLNGVDGATLTDITATGATGGFGMSISSSANVTVTNLTTNGNAWGDVGIFPANSPYQWPSLEGPTGITFGGTLDLSSGAGSISVQDGSLQSGGTWTGTISNDPADGADVTVPAAFSHVVNSTRDADGLVLHNVGPQAAIHALGPILAANGFSGTTIDDLDNGDLEVVEGLSIQDAIDAASAGNVIQINDGSYAIATTIDVSKAVTLQGASEAGVVLTCDAALSGSYGLKVTASSATLKDFTLDGSGVAVFGIHVQPGTSNSTIQGVTAHGCVQNGISLTGTNDTEGRNTITGITVHSNGLLGLGLGASQNVTVSDVTSYSNAFGDIGMYIGDYEGQQNDDLIFEEPLALSGGFGGISYTIEANDPAGFEVTPSTADATDALYNADANIFVPAAYNHSVQVHVPASPYNADLTSYVLTQDAAAALIAGALNVAPNDNVAVQNLETGAWEVSAGLSIGVAAGLATEGDVIEVAAGGTYAESLTIDKGLSIDGNGSTLDVSGLGVGISIQSDVDGVTIDNLTIVGDASTYSGITVNPGASNVSILNNNISGMALSNPGNSSPLSYGILCWGNTDPVNPPTNVLIDGNEIHGVSGTAISLGDNTEGVTISNNHFHSIGLVTVNGAPWSSGVVAGQANNLAISGNNMEGLGYASVLTACTGVTLDLNQYTGGTSLLLLASLPNSILPDAADWWSLEAAAIGYIYYFNSEAAQAATDAGLQAVGIPTVLSSSNPGCMEADACNFDSTALSEDGSCTYPPATYFDCNGACENDADGDGICDELEGLIPELETACGANTVWDPALGQCIMNAECIGDVDLDGHIGSTDLLYLLGNFGTFCQDNGGE